MDSKRNKTGDWSVKDSRQRSPANAEVQSFLSVILEIAKSPLVGLIWIVRV
jgi:hypothetical protein